MRTEPCLSWCVYEKGACRYCGWPKDRSNMALMVWDPTTMERRVATQHDIDELELVRSAYARILARFHEDRGMLIDDIKKLRSRSGMPNDLMVDPSPVSPPE